MQPELAGDLVVQVLRTTNTFLRASRRLFRPHGLTEAQFNVLNLLARRPAGLTQREISDALVVDRSNVTGLLDRMETLGWTRREPVPGDRRAWRVRLTAAGRRLWSRVAPSYERTLTRTVAAALDPGQARNILAGLQRLERAAAGVAARGRPEAGKD